MLTFDTSWIGKEFDRYAFEVTQEDIAEFAASVGEEDLLYCDAAYARSTTHGGIVAPATFCIVVRSSAPLPDLKLSYGARAFDGGKECVFHAPIRPGDIITGVDRIAEVYEKTGRSGNMIFVVRESELTNQHGDKVAVLRQILIQRD
jgi:acyl dehydratase